MDRRSFIKSTAAAAGAGFLILPSGWVSGQNAPSNKLNLALIGTWGRMNAHFDAVSSENVIALCDVNEPHIVEAAKKFPKAEIFTDWRKCLDKKGIDAVVIATCDHTHAFIANWAINRGFHVYCEKPLANTVNEARIVRANFLKNKGKIATQCGTQRHQMQNFNRLREMIKDGAIGTLQSAIAWGNRQIPKPGYLPAAGAPPSNLHWDLWLGPSPEHPYNPEYFAGGPGANCLKWNMYWDFGSGQVGDMGSHTMDLVWNVIDAKLPTTAEGKGDPFNKDVTPVALETHFDHPANDWRPAIRVAWYQGGLMPASPRESGLGWVDLKKVGHGALFKGSKGHILADFGSRILIPSGDAADMTYYKPREAAKLEATMPLFQKEWINACKGNLKTSCDFEYSGNMIEQMLLGLVAYRVGKPLKYDGEKGLTNNETANALLTKEYRKGWTIDG